MAEAAKILDLPLAETSRVHPDARRGRGTVSNAAGRYERHSTEQLDDGWCGLDEAPPPLRTVVVKDTSKTILARNTSPDVGFDRSINPYRGCEHGCVYCFARPTHAYLGWSPGLDFESKLTAKPEAAQLLEKELRKPRYRVRHIALGTNTDPYQPVERNLKITRAVMEVLAKFKHPATILTKSALVTRDIDILKPMAEQNLVKVSLSITTLDRKLARRMEPRAATPSRRLEAIERLTKAGIPTGVMFAPVIPGLNEPEMEKVLKAAKDAGAQEAGYVVLRVPLEIKDLVREWLDENYPDRTARVFNQLKQMHGGAYYDPTWSRRQKGQGPLSQTLSQRFRLAITRLGFHEDPVKLRSDLFRPPARSGDQLSLF